VRVKQINVVLTALMLLASSAFAQESVFENLKFKDADIKIVLQAIAEQASREGKKINILTSPEVQGMVSINLDHVDWETALNVLLKANNYSYYRYRNVITVASPATIQVMEQADLGKQTEQFTGMKIFRLKFIDAGDAARAAVPLLSKVGKVSVLDTTGRGGWAFGSATPERTMGAGQASTQTVYMQGSTQTVPTEFKRSKVLIVSDVPSKIEQISNLIDEIDVMAKQILIRAKIMEVNRNALMDIGVDWGTGSTGGELSTITTVDLNGKNNAQIGAHSLATVTPSAFLPQSTGLTTSNAGLKLLVKHLTGTQFEVVMHALEEKANTNTLSEPTVVTLNNQEASILIGTKFPIIKTDVSTQTNYILGGSLQEYKDIGIQLNVVPQIWGEKDEYISMIVHPAVSSYSTTEKVVSQDGTVLVQYPIISTREAQTQLVVKDGETVVMGGLLKDARTKEDIGIPFLRKIPFFGNLFTRKTKNSEKVDLLIFITAQIVKPGELMSKEILDTAKVTDNFSEKGQAGK